MGGQPASLPVDSNSRACFAALPAVPILIRNWQWQWPLRRAGRQLQPRAGFAEAVLCLFAQLLAGNREGEKTVEYFFWLALPLPLSLCVCFFLLPFSFWVQVTFHGILFFWDFVIFSNMSWDLQSCARDAKDTVSGLS